MRLFFHNLLLVALVAGSSPARAQTTAELLDQGRRHIGEGRLAEAADAFSAAIKTDSGSVAAWRGLASALHRLERYPEALAALDRGFALDPKDFGVRFNRGLTLSELGRISDARVELDTAITLRPNSAPAWTERGAANALLGQTSEAREDWQRALALDSNYIWPRFYRGIAAITDGDYKAAIADLDAVTAKQSLLSAHLWRWVAYRLDGRPAPELRTDDADWPGPIAEFFAGEISERQLISAARAKRLPLDERRLASAHFFIAQKHLAERRMAEARGALARVSALRVPRHAEVVAAEAQVRRLTRP